MTSKRQCSMRRTTLRCCRDACETGKRMSTSKWRHSPRRACATSSVTWCVSFHPTARSSIAYTILRKLHGDAYGWKPPHVPGLERLGATRMRQYVRAWINEWDLVRMDPAYRPSTKVVELESNYLEMAEDDD